MPRKSTPVATQQPIATVSHAHTIPVTRGIQSGREYYSAMIRFRTLRKMIVFDPESQSIPIEQRSQRDLNLSRVKKISAYILKAFTVVRKKVNPSDDHTYVFGAVVISIDTPVGADLEFTAHDENHDWGMLGVPEGSTFWILDGQHRIFGSIAALNQMSELDHESLTVIFFLDTGKRWRDQAFADLNRLAVNISKSLKLLFNVRDPDSLIATTVVSGVDLFNRFTDRGRTSLPPKSARLFTLNGIHDGTKALLVNHKNLSAQEQAQIAIHYWSAVARNMAYWNDVANKWTTPGEVREVSVSTHAVTLVALGKLGAELLKLPDWETKLEKLQNVDWDRANPDWYGHLIVTGKIQRKADTWLKEYLSRTVMPAHSENDDAG